MKVKELIELLKTQPQDLEVVLNSYEDGFDPATGLRQLSLGPHPIPHWANGVFDEAAQEGQPALLIWSKYLREEKG